METTTTGTDVSELEAALAAAEAKAKQYQAGLVEAEQEVADARRDLNQAKAQREHVAYSQRVEQIQAEARASAEAAAAGKSQQA